MIIIELTYIKPLDEANKYLEEHRDFVKACYDEGLLLASGPKKPRAGGIIIALTDEETIREKIQEDPFYRHNIAAYRFIQFEPNKCREEISTLVE